MLTILHVQGSEYAFGARNYTIVDLDRALSKLPFGWVLSPFVHGRLQNMKTTEETLPIPLLTSLTLVQ